MISITSILVFQWLNLCHSSLFQTRGSTVKTPMGVLNPLDMMRAINGGASEKHPSWQVGYLWWRETRGEVGWGAVFETPSTEEFELKTRCKIFSEDEIEVTNESSNPLPACWKWRAFDPTVCSGANLDTKTEIVMVWRNGTFFAFPNALLYRDNS